MDSDEAFLAEQRRLERRLEAAAGAAVQAGIDPDNIRLIVEHMIATAGGAPLTAARNRERAQQIAA